MSISFFAFLFLVNPAHSAAATVYLSLSGQQYVFKLEPDYP